MSRPPFDPTTSDGCSIPAVLKKLVPALAEFAAKCDHDACLRHDQAYHYGGSAAERIEADYQLFLVARTRCGEAIAALVFDAVRFYGGTAWGTGRPWHGGEERWREPTEAP
jgi:hypothetical protein